MTSTGDQSQQSSQQSSGGAKEVRRKANERVGQWIKRKYCLESLLGVGGMATVYAARHRNGSRMALKILHTEFAREEGVRTRFLREGYVANKVEHPGVVQILDDDETEQGEPFLVMELLEGQTLQQLWKRRKRKVPVVEALRICAAVLDALEPFHELNIIHRDIKPANIFITHADEVKLLDFGVAQMREHGEAMTRAGTALGTPSFMSPEQAMGKSDQLDGRSDVFAIGATLYAILSGHRLHHGKSDNEAFILAATQPAPSLARVAPELQTEVIALVDKSLQWDRRKRHGTAAEMRDACLELVRQLGGPGGMPAPEPPPPVRAPMPSRPSAPQRPSVPGMAAQRQGAPQALAPSSAPLKQTPHSGISERATNEPPPPPRRASRAQIAAEAPPAEARENHPALDLFQRFEKALPTLRHYGIDHPEGQSRVRAIHATTIDTLRALNEPLVFQVHPFCFSDGPTTLWEPGPPNDQVPYGMAASGVEQVVIKPGVTEEEMRAFVKTVVVDPLRGLTEGSIGAALWEASLDHIECSIREDVAVGDAREQIRFFSESEELETNLLDQLANAMAQTGSTDFNREDQAELRAMALTTDTESFKAAHQATEALRLDATTSSALAAQLNVDIAEWRDRFYDVAVDALGDAVSREDSEIIYATIRAYADRMVKADLWDALLDTHDKLAQRVSAQRLGSMGQSASPEDVSRQFFHLGVLDRAFSALSEDGKIPEAHRARLMASMVSALQSHDGSRVLAFVDRANALPAGELRELAMSYVERHVDGHQQAIIDKLDTLEPAMAQRMLALVSQTLGAGAVDMLKPLLTSPNAALKCEATALLSDSPDALGKQLVHLLGSSDEAIRASALTTMLRHEVRQAGPGLIGVIEGERFRTRPPAEQRQMFDTLYALHPPRAEKLLIGIVKQHGMLADEELDRIRCVAAESLGHNADSVAPLPALEDAARLRPWNTQALRAAASNGIAAIRDRLRTLQEARG